MLPKVQGAPRKAALALSAVKTERNRTPAASNTAFEIALGTTAADGSPPSLDPKRLGHSNCLLLRSLPLPQLFREALLKL
jgi:hypothetical protein